MRIGNLYFNGNRGKNKIALTFDDGPCEETEKILKILKKHNVKATFFIWGQKVSGNEDIIKKIIKEGHEIGNHSYEHQRLKGKTRDYIEKDLIKCDEELDKAGVKTDLFRPPAFDIGINLWLTCLKLKKKIIFCDLDSDDWTRPGVEQVAEKVLNNAKNGAIIDFHDYLEGIGPNPDISPIMDKLIPVLKEKYEMVTLSELFNL